jgi:hypothetical protein
VNGEESRLTFEETAVVDLDIVDMVEEGNPDCVIFVYAVDDPASFGEAVS